MAAGKTLNKMVGYFLAQEIEGQFVNLRTLKFGCIALSGLLVSVSFAQKPHKPNAGTTKKPAEAKDCMCVSILRDNAGPFSEGHAAIKVNGVWGFVDRSGHMVIAPRFNDGDPFSEGVTGAEDDESHTEGYLDPQGKWAIAPQFETAFSFVNGIAAVVDKDRTYGIDHSGQHVIEPQKDTMLDGRIFFDGPALRVSRKDIYQRWSSKGELLATFSAPTQDAALKNYPLYMSLRDAGEGLVPAWSGGEKTGYVDFSGKWVIAQQFDEAKKFIAGHAVAKSGDKYGVIDHKGAWVVQPEWASIDVDENGKYSLHASNDVNSVDASASFDEHGAWKQEKLVLKTIAPGVLGARKAGANDPDEYGDLVDASGQSLLRPVWSNAGGEPQMPERFKAELVTLSGAAHAAILLTYSADKQSKLAPANSEDLVDHYAVLFPAEHKLLRENWTTEYTNSNAVELENSSSGDDGSAKVPQALLFRDTGEMLTVKGDIAFFKGDWSKGAAGFAFLSSKEDGTGGGYGLIDREGQRFLPDTFDDPGDFEGGLAAVCKDQTHQCGAVDEQGHIAVPFAYDHVSAFIDGYAFVEKDGKPSILARSGQLYDWPTQYDHMERLKTAGLFLVKKEDGKSGVLRADGKVILPPIYDGVEELPGGLFKMFVYKGGDMLYGVASADGTVLLEPAFHSLEQISDQSAPGLLTAQRVVNGDKAVLDAKGHPLTEFDVTDIEGGDTAKAWLLTERKQKRLLLADGTLIPLPADTKEYELLPDNTVLTETDNAYGLADTKGNAVSAWYRQLDYLGDGVWSGQGPLGHEDLLGADGHVLYTLPDSLHAMNLLQDAQKQRRRLLVMGHGSDSDSEYALFDWENGGKRIALPESSTDVTAGEDGWVSVQIGQECMFVDMNGKVVTKVAASSLEGLHDGRAIAAAMGKDGEENPLSGVVDAHGRWIVPPRYVQMLDSSESRIWAETPRGDIELLDEQGHVLGRRITRGNEEVWVAAQSIAPTSASRASKK